MRAALAAAMLLAGCSGEEAAREGVRAPDLETAAIARGLVRDPADTDLTGLYARDTDRVCIVEDGNAYRIGAFVDYGDGITCSATGRVTRRGDVLRVAFGEACRFDAGYDGARITFPATLPEECKRFCRSRAVFAAVDVERLSGSNAEAAALRGARGELLCASDEPPRAD